MSDREMLELAAKAANLQTWTNEDGGLYLPDPMRRWNPLTDDGDALRLAVRLRFGIKDFSPHDDEPDATPDNTPSVGMIEIWRESDDDDPLYVEWYKAGFNRYAATRRAITNAAALIGKDMP